MEASHKIEYKVRGLNTRSVVFFPTRAQVVREITAVNLKPGTNEITVNGLSPTIEQESIKVEASVSSAIITNIAVESCPNREIYEEVYSDGGRNNSHGNGNIESESDSDSYSDSDSDSDPNQEQSPEVSEAQDRLQEIQTELELANETVDTAISHLKILESYAASLPEGKEVMEIYDELERCKYSRQETLKDRIEGEKVQRRLREQLRNAKRQLAKLKRQDVKERAKDKIRRENERRKSLKRKRDEEKQNEQDFIRREREKFWPRYCYSVCITIEYHTNTTPSLSRGYFTGQADMMQVSSPKPTEADDVAPCSTCDFVLSYLTSSAGWTPRYDLQLSTTNRTATLYFNAQLTNATSETWSNCKIVLSTSEVTFDQLGDAIPTLNPWKIKLAPQGSSDKKKEILKSREESTHYTNGIASKKSHVVNKPRGEMFMNADLCNNTLGGDEMQLKLLEQRNKKVIAMSELEAVSTTKHVNKPNTATNSHPQLQHQMKQQQVTHQEQQMQAAQLQPVITNHGPFNLAIMQSSFGLSQRASPPPPPGPSSAYPARVSHSGIEADQAILSQTEENDQTLGFEKSLVKEMGFTTLYEPVGLKTMAPTSTLFKQRVARITFSNVYFYHLATPKHSAVANLTARIKNTSQLTLLRGLAGLTLDGSFLGHKVLRRCSAGDFVGLNLGVDPAIKIVYSQPEVRRAKTFRLNKEHRSIYARSLMIQNSQGSEGQPMHIRVRDQIPVSEDGRLRVEFLNPRGIQVDGPSILVGEPGRDALQDKDWGTAKAWLQQDGLVQWQVTLNTGKAVRLVMEYSVSFPDGQKAIEC